MKGLSHVAMGQFYEGIKAQTKVMLNDPLPGQKASPEYLKVKYLRGELKFLFISLIQFCCFLNSFESAHMLIVGHSNETIVYSSECCRVCHPKMYGLSSRSYG